MRRISRLWGIAAGMMAGLVMLASAQGEATRYALDDTYAVSVPSSWQVVDQSEGLIAVSGDGLGILIYSPSLVSEVVPANEPILDAVLATFGVVNPGIGITADEVVQGTVNGRDAAFADTEQVIQGQSYAVRFYAIRMSDGFVGVLNVIAFSGTPGDSARLIEAILGSFDVNEEQAETTPEAESTDAPDPTPAPPTPTVETKPAESPTITPTPAPLSPTSGDYALTVVPSDNEATCSVGFFPLEAALGTLEYSGALIAARNGDTVNFTVNSGGLNGALRLERDSEGNLFAGLLRFERWSVSVQLELIAPGRFAGRVTSPFTIIEGGNTVACVDDAAITLQAE